MAFTYFFRDTYTLEIAIKFLLPEISGRSKITIWDAGCANGPEPYSLAILLAENMTKYSFNNLKINATDIDESGQFGDIIKNAVYSGEEVGRIPEAILNKYFEKNINGDKKVIVKDSIKTKLNFYKHDLLSLKPFSVGNSLVICKNVLLHFQYAERVKVIRMFADSLMRGGIFATEQTQKMPSEVDHLFEKVVADAQVFRKL